MADSKFDICNKALVLVGANTISSFTQNTTESKVANQLYESTLENLLTRCRWRFASKQAQLSKNTANPDARYDSSYALPNDAHIIHTVTVGDDVIKYDRYGQNLFTNTTSSDTVIADYTFQPSESIFPPYFKQRSWRPLPPELNSSGRRLPPVTRAPRPDSSPAASRPSPTRKAHRRPKLSADSPQTRTCPLLQQQ